MRVLTVHNYYRQPGGEDTVFRAEAELLRAAGHDVKTYSVSNDTIPEGSGWHLAVNATWNRDAFATVRSLVQQHRCELVHFHNTFPLLSPAVFHAARRAGAAVVVSLHNPRLMCPSANFFRNGHSCMDCLGKPLAWPGILHGCYRQSRAQTAVNAGVSAVHRVIRTWSSAVDRFIVFTEYYRALFARAALPAAKLVVKPHYVNVSWEPGAHRADGYALYVGRLDPEKGVRTMLRAFELVTARSPGAALPLFVRGEGHLEPLVRRSIESGRVQGRIVERLPVDELHALMGNARCLVWPSESSYETFGLVAAEAMACGTPVLASDGGVAPYVVPAGAGGLHFRSGDADDLARRILELSQMPAAAIHSMRVRARRVFEERYAPQANISMLEAIYDQALTARTSRAAGSDRQSLRASA